MNILLSFLVLLVITTIALGILLIEDRWPYSSFALGFTIIILIASYHVGKMLVEILECLI